MERTDLPVGREVRRSSGIASNHLQKMPCRLHAATAANVVIGDYKHSLCAACMALTAQYNSCCVYIIGLYLQL